LIIDMTHVHFIGIGGSGLSAIARLLKDSGYTVTGSDRSVSTFTNDLQAAGVLIYIGHHPHNIKGADWVVRSSAIPDDNPEVVAARHAAIPVYKRADFLGKWMEDKTGIAVAGTHGKTTTTAMIAHVLMELGRDPSFIVGGVMNNLGINARAGKGTPFVIEADEYDRMFLGLKPRIEVITNVEHDHPDCYPTFEEMVAAFESFVSLLPNDGTLIACIEDQGASSLMNKARRLGRHVVGYTIKTEITIKSQHWVQARGIKSNARGGFDFEAVINLGNEESVQVSLQVPGEHNVLNALAVLAVIAVLGLSIRAAGVSLGKFTGTSRRFEIKGKKKGITVIDDYAHHPTEIKATLAAARARYPKQRLWAVWQPHTYSRTKALLQDFIHAFEDADEVIVTEIFASREPKQDYSSQEVVKAMSHPSVRFLGTLKETTDYLVKNLHKQDVLLVLSAGDADQVSVNVLARL
jgi:UDP-N-acetylmuramate--alanine ligase